MLPEIFRRRPQMLPPQEAYAIWAESYPPHPHNPLMEVEQAAVAPVIASCASSAPTRALDVGTGSGRYLPMLAATGARVVCGIDFSMPMLRRHVGEYARVCADAYRIPFQDGAFDLVSSSLMMGDIADLARCIAELSRVLAPGGHLVYSDFHTSWGEGKWRRTFEGPDGRSFELACCPHSVTAHLAHLDRYGLDVPAVHEAGVPGSGSPAIAVFHAVKRA